MDKLQWQKLKNTLEHVYRVKMSWQYDDKCGTSDGTFSDKCPTENRDIENRE